MKLVDTIERRKSVEKDRVTIAINPIVYDPLAPL
jgi:hypothetical protein